MDSLDSMCITSNHIPICTNKFTKVQLGWLNTLIDEAFLPKLGINRKMNRTVLRAPIELGGIALPNVQTIQDQKWIVNVMRQLQLGKEIATDFWILLAQAQLDSGFVHPILEITDIDISYIEPGMIVHLHNWLEALDRSIVIENQWCPMPQRVNDESIMAKLSKLPGVKPRLYEIKIPPSIPPNITRQLTFSITILQCKWYCSER